MKEKQYDASNEEEIANREKKIKQEREKELNDIKFILSTPQGLRFFQRFCEDGHIFKTSMTGNSYTYFNEGERNFALRYFGDIVEACPEMIQKLIVKKVE